MAINQTKRYAEFRDLALSLAYAPDQVFVDELKKAGVPSFFINKLCHLKNKSNAHQSLNPFYDPPREDKIS